MDDEEFSIVVGWFFPEGEDDPYKRYYGGSIYWKDRNGKRHEYTASMFMEKEDYEDLSEENYTKTKNKIYHLICLGLLRNRFGNIDYNELKSE